MLRQCVEAVCCGSVLWQCVEAVCCGSVLRQCVVAVCCGSTMDFVVAVLLFFCMLDPSENHPCNYSKTPLAFLFSLHMSTKNFFATFRHEF